MNALVKGIIVAALHLAIVLSLGGKLLYDRASRPRVWVLTGTVDPDLPIRGRYFTLNLQVQAPDFKGFDPKQYGVQNVWLDVENGRLIAHQTNKNTGLYMANWGWNRAGQPAQSAYMLSPPVTFFIAEHAETPHLNRGDEMRAEVTIPKKGPPRPIQLAIKRGTEWRPLTYR